GEGEETKRETDYFLSKVTESTCQRCFMKERCWQKEFDTTYSLMESLKEDLADGKEPKRSLMRECSNHCVQSSKVLGVREEEIPAYEAHQQVREQVRGGKRR